MFKTKYPLSPFPWSLTGNWEGKFWKFLKGTYITAELKRPMILLQPSLLIVKSIAPVSYSVLVLEERTSIHMLKILWLYWLQTNGIFSLGHLIMGDPQCYYTGGGWGSAHGPMLNHRPLWWMQLSGASSLFRFKYSFWLFRHRYIRPLKSPSMRTRALPVPSRHYPVLRINKWYFFIPVYLYHNYWSIKCSMSSIHAGQKLLYNRYLVNFTEVYWSAIFLYDTT